jgi:S1-C subfamily serine protease
MGHPQKALAAVFVFLAVASLSIHARGKTESGNASLQDRIHKAASKAVPYIVQVEVTQTFQQYPIEAAENEYRKSGLGSGILIQRAGEAAFLLTNNHVLDEADEIMVRLFDGELLPGTVQGRDVRRDLAVVRFQTARKLQMARLGDSNRVQVGDLVMAVGSPLGLESSVTLGVVSAVGRRGGPGGNISDFIQTDSVINPGNSGGALVNLAGEVVGVNTWIASQSGQYEGFGFAIPVNTVKRSVRYLLSSRDAVYGWLGVGCVDPPEALRAELGFPPRGGALVMNLYLGSPASNEGLRLGDLLEQIDGRNLQGTADLVQSVADSEPRQTVIFRVLRSGQLTNVSVRVAERPSEKDLAAMNDRFWPGWIAIDSVGEDMPEGGAELVQVFGSTPADRADFRVGDIILQVDDVPVSDAFRLLAALGAKDVKPRITILRGKSRLEKELARMPEEVGP